MLKIASLSVVVLVAWAAMGVHKAEAQPARAPSPTPKGLECHDKSLTGSGAGFKSSQQESEEAAIADWLEKAKAIYPEADWTKAKDPNIQCVKQGLYSKCFADGIPCRPQAAN